MYIFYTWRWYGYEFTENHHVAETALILIFYDCSTNTNYLRQLPTPRSLQAPRKFFVMIQRHTTRVTLSNLVIKEHFFQAETSWRT
jgi:hypothetical protein